MYNQNFCGAKVYKYSVTNLINGVFYLFRAVSVFANIAVR